MHHDDETAKPPILFQAGGRPRAWRGGMRINLTVSREHRLTEQDTFAGPHPYP